MNIILPFMYLLIEAVVEVLRSILNFVCIFAESPTTNPSPSIPGTYVYISDLHVLQGHCVFSVNDFGNYTVVQDS